jgi:exosome complex component RRP41|eukprot:TRINITY_DN71896_c0_g1_i1.p1 TRINITY_DN71896_c0_g1~~TRINITY_DN71896_c0_g1_i1.p1  ORF type:complete len:249 (+),score=81.15 TRINITY_DN71896_c0_g1_i1:59-805(+)
MAGFELLSDQGLRLDGRKAGELRRLQCRMGVYGQADGSAYLEQGNTKVLAAVYGPHDMRDSRLRALHDRVVVNCQYSMAVFSTGERKRRPRGDRKSQEMSQHLKQTFEATIKTELYPRSQIDIFVEVLQADGGNYCACVNAATLALIDAGIPLVDYVSACTASLVVDTPLVDVSSLEATTGGPELTVAAHPKSGQIVLLEMSHRFHMDHLDKVVEVALGGCRDIHTILDTVVRRHVANTGAQLGWDQK